MLKITQNHGFQLTFSNNLTISVQFGTNNYCERKNYHALGHATEMKKDIITSANAEIAIWDKNNKWFDFGSDQVKGYLNSNEIADWIEKVSKATDINLK